MPLKAKSKGAKGTKGAKGSKGKSRALPKGGVLPKRRPIFPPLPDVSRTESLLMRACEANDLDGFYAAVWRKANVNCKKPLYGSTPLAIACRQGNMQLSQTLLKLGADAALPDQFGATPLHWAANSGNEALLQCILREGRLLPTDLRRQDIYGSTPLHFASVRNLSASVLTLVEGGVDVNLVNKSGARASALTTDVALRQYLLEQEELQARRDQEDKRTRTASGKKKSSAKKKRSEGETGDTAPTTPSTTATARKGGLTSGKSRASAKSGKGKRASLAGQGSAAKLGSNGAGNSSQAPKPASGDMKTTHAMVANPHDPVAATEVPPSPTQAARAVAQEHAPGATTAPLANRSSPSSPNTSLHASQKSLGRRLKSPPTSLHSSRESTISRSRMATTHVKNIGF